MAVAQKIVNGNLVFYDDANPHRWFDAIGPNVVKVVEDFQYLGFAAADTPDGWTVTLVEAGAGDTTVALVAGSAGGELLITTDAADNDGANLQVKGEAFDFSSAYPTYFGIRYKTGEATQSDFLAGLCITDTTLLDGLSDGIYFRKVDASTSVSFVAEKNSVETEIAAIDTQAADTYAWLEFVCDGTWLTVYVDGTATARMLATNANVPNDEYLTPSIHFLTGEAASKTCTIDKIVAIQIQA